MADREGVGPPYWVAARLTVAARHNWTVFDGWCASRAVDPMDLPPDRFLNLVYWWLVRGADEKRRQEIDRNLDRVPSGEQAEVETGPWSADSEMAAFAKASVASSSL